MSTRAVRAAVVVVAVMSIFLQGAPAGAVAGLSLSRSCNANLQCVNAECKAHVALFETDGQVSLVISGTANAEGPVAPASTSVTCAVLQIGESGFPESRGGCSLRLVGPASACAGTVANVDLAPITVCSAGDAAFMLTGTVATSDCAIDILDAQ